jgi:protease IV
MSNKRSGCLGLILVGLLALSLIFNIVVVVFVAPKIPAAGLTRHDLPEFQETTVATGRSDEKIALITLRGVISSSVDGDLGENMVEDLKLGLRQAIEDRRVKAILLRIDSPGGEVTASDTIYHAVCEAREKKPVVVYMDSVAASGGYYVACGGSYLMANDTTITGSIGVIIQTLRYEELFGKIGLESIVFKSGQFKDTLSGARAMTPEEKAYIQSLVMQTYDKFLGIVATERGLDAGQLRQTIADGRILSGRDAVQFKLVHQIGYLEDAYAKARELGGAPGAAVVRYQAPFKLGRFFRMLGERAQGRVRLELPGWPFLSSRLESGRIYLLPAHYVP